MSAPTNEQAPDGLPIRPFESSADWERWLEENHVESSGLWIKMAKKASGIPTVSMSDAIDVAICFGWIDGQRRGHDETWYLQRFTPRRPRSRWSEINVERVRRLTDGGRMRPAGLAEVERAKADGRWEDAYPRASALEVPNDLQEALDANAAAATGFASMPSSDRYSILYRLYDAKKPETRARIIEQFLASLSKGAEN